MDDQQHKQMFPGEKTGFIQVLIKEDPTKDSIQLEFNLFDDPLTNSQRSI
ncbi:hypothetical protein [Fictibacillus fluitans]|uniref:Uncharacterized protein n=1 Tax=Fictibacillus fluitans TaxID=3058422 RepID=A0ABT8I0B5_9BACL|nr:hypothetical protein [Fictibacillus sp. NE201]MDN4526399.1 hypothetical protein [Fictibacillus sp. NE201]